MAKGIKEFFTELFSPLHPNYSQQPTFNDYLTSYANLLEEQQNTMPEQYVNPSDKARQRGWTNTSNRVATPTQENMTATANPVPTVPTVQDEQERMLQMQQQAANRNALTAYERAMKYLPQLQKEQGLYGLGVSESGQIAAQNDLVSRLAQTDLYYDQMRQQQSQERSQQYMQMASAALQNAESADEAKQIAEMYRPYLSGDDRNMIDLYIGQLESPAYQEQATRNNVDALWDTARSGGYKFKHNYAGGKNKWAVGDQFVIEESGGKNRNVEIAEVNPGGDNILIGLANKAGNEQLFFYNGDLYMVKDQDTADGKKRELYRLAFMSETGKSNMLNAYQAQA